MAMSDNLRGALFMSLSMAGFALNDAIMKQVLVAQPLFPTILIRGCFATLLLAGLCLMTGALRWRGPARDRRLIGWRILAEIATTVLFLSALARMPIADATALLQAAPLAVTLAAALFLGEAVGWRRATALAVGFVGVMLIVQPGTGAFAASSLLVVAAVGTIVLRDLATRQLSAGAPSLLVALLTSVAITLTGAVGSVGRPWPAFTSGQIGFVALASVLLIIAYVFSVRAMRVGEIAFVSPFRYTVLLWALLLGLVVFGEVPSPLMLIGATLVVGSGLFTFWREQRAR